MQEAADEALWEYDHPVLSAIEFIAGIVAGIIGVLLLVAGLIVLTFAFSVIAGVGMVAAGLILVAGMAAFSIGFAFGARLAAGQGFGEALGGAFMDFGR